MENIVEIKKPRKSVLKIALHSAYAVVVMSVILGLAYPIFTTFVANLLFPHQANGSIIEYENRSVGSELIGQDFNKLGYFMSRPSANGYDGAASSGSNFSASNPKQAVAIKERETFWKEHIDPNIKIPADLLTASASGIDLHISYEAAIYQIPVVMKNTGLSESQLRVLIDQSSIANLIKGSGMVNVLKLNIAVDKLVKQK